MHDVFRMVQGAGYEVVSVIAQPGNTEDLDETARCVNPLMNPLQSGSNPAGNVHIKINIAAQEGHLKHAHHCTKNHQSIAIGRKFVSKVYVSNLELVCEYRKGVLSS